MVSRIFVLVVIGLLVAQRLGELRHSRNNERLLRARGAVEHARTQVPWMIALHAAWFVALLVESMARPVALPWALRWTALAIFLFGQFLRLRAMHALGTLWSVKVLTLPGTLAVGAGPFRFIRHPNYLGVLLETIALPLVLGAPFTAALFGVAQTVFLAFRIRAEEAALSENTDYARTLGPRGRFLPRRRHGLV